MHRLNGVLGSHFRTLMKQAGLEERMNGTQGNRER